MKRALPLLALLFCLPLATAQDRADVLIADFEGDTYPEGWKTTGTAFGKGPARGTLPGQMAVSGFLGKGLVNSFTGGDASTGTLTSPAFQIDRKYLNFVIGGGNHAGKTCVNLIVGGKAVRSATGPNDKPGGSEHLDWRSWDVTEFAGKGAIIEIVDDENGGWGHITADHFVQSDKKKQLTPVVREFMVESRYLHLPVKTGAAMKRMKFLVGKDVVREFDIELADGVEPNFWAFADVSAFKGKMLTVETMLLSGSKALDALKQANDVPAAENVYREKHRPLFHFTSRFGWLNDPNGLVYHDKEWHLFYQHNPFGVNWGNMHWGHAVSPDLMRWKEEGIALYPKKYGDWAFSGSAVVDNGNTSGWGTKEKPSMVLAYTSTGRGECIAYSTDKGRNWIEYDQNPVVKHSGRDPKLVWYEKGKHWVMAVYDEFEKKQWIAFYTSPDLKTWTFMSRIEGFYECPDLFDLPRSSNPQFGTDWVLYGADGKYLIGDFDGKVFKPDFEKKKQLWYGKFYAAQTFSNVPDDVFGRSEELRIPRRIQIGWANGVTFPKMPFNQQMSVPVELHFYPKRDGSILTAWPVEAVEKLREAKPAAEISSVKVTAEMPFGKDLDAFDMTLDVDGKNGFTLSLRGNNLVYDAKKQTLTCKDVTAPIAPHAGPNEPGNSKLTLRILVDRGSIEVFGNHGQVAMSIAAIPNEKNRKVQFIPDGAVLVNEAKVWRMNSAWAK